MKSSWSPLERPYHRAVNPILVVLESLKSYDATAQIWSALCVPFVVRAFIAWMVEGRLRGPFRVEGARRADFPRPNSVVREWAVFAVALILAWVPAFAATSLFPGLSTDVGHALCLGAAVASALYAYVRLRADDRRSRGIRERNVRERAAAGNRELDRTP
jgi:hypothetical protein